MCDIVLGAEIGHLLTRKVHSTVGYNGKGSLKQHTMLFQRNLTICFSVTLEIGTTLTHFVEVVGGYQ